MQFADKPFKDYWTSTLYPAIKGDYERLLKTTPTRIGERAEKEKADKDKKDKAQPKEEQQKKKKDKEKDPVQEKLGKTLEDVKEKGERRNVYMNLAWTGPIDNSFLQDKLPLAKVENMAADLFLKNLATEAETAPDSQEGADDVEGPAQSKPQRRAVEIFSGQGRRPWQIPTAVEKGFEIPIVITSANQWAAPDIGKFKRLAMDVVVNAVWLAYFWAKEEGNKAAVTALEKLILDWPFDFIHIPGSSTEEIEENKFKWAVNMAARHERLRDFVGLENSNLLRIVAKAVDLVRAKTAGGGRPKPEKVQEWLKVNLNWGLLHCPDENTVKRHMDNWSALENCPTAMQLIEAAVSRWGRDNLLDWPTKLGIIVQKTDSASLGYAVEALYTRMWRKGQKDPYGSGALGVVVNEILWARTYVVSFLRKFPELFKVSTAYNSQGSNSTQDGLAESQYIKTARLFLDSPLKFYLQTEGPDKDPTWLQSLPNEALRLTMRHFLDLNQGFYTAEIAGALSQPKSERYNIEKFYKGLRISKRFCEPFHVAYDSLVGCPKGGSDEKKADTEKTGAATADGAKAIAQEVAAEEKKKLEVSPSDVTTFRAQCENACKQEIDARVVLIVAEGTAVEINASLTQTRLYQNLSESSTVMGFYDIKNARLCNVFEGQGLTHREPAVDEADLERYLKSLCPLMQPGRDVLWVLTGRTESNLPKIKKLLGENNFHCQQFHLCYNMKQMQAFGHFKRQRGVANSRSHEIMLLCYKGRLPKNLATTRAHVDPGSTLFQEVVKNVPVLPQKSHALVTKEVREISLQNMVGTCVTEVEATDREKNGLPPAPPNDEESGGADADAATAVAPEKALVTAVLKKRKLYRQLTGSEVPWFPHDNDMELLKELCHEAGKPRWVYFGTPAGGAGMHGCIEFGCSVLALTVDEHHKKHLGPFLVERAVEAMLGSSTLVFMNESLLTRAVQLRLTRQDAKEDHKEDKKEDAKEKKKEPKKEKKSSEEKAKKKKESKKKNDDESSSSSSSSSDSEEGKPKKKKSKNKD